MDTNYDNAKDYNTNQYTYDTLLALVDTIIPRTPDLARMYGNSMYYGAVDLLIQEYVTYLMDYINTQYADLLADLLNLVAEQLYLMEGKENLQSSMGSPLFAQLSLTDRIRALSMFAQAEEYFPDLMQQLLNYPGLFVFTASLAGSTMMGFYSEWYGYGTTRLEEPDNRQLQFYPVSWLQVGYPGPSLSYVSYVNKYYLLKQSLENI